MAIHAKSNGWLIAGEIIEETSSAWIFRASDEKNKKVIAKNDPKNKVFNGDNAVGDAQKWQISLRSKK